MPNKTNILIIEDDPSTGIKLQKQLEQKEYNVEVVEEGRVGLQRLMMFSFHVILLDLGLPDITGEEVLVEVRKKFSYIELPVIVLSASENSSDVIKALKLGANDYMVKPAYIQTVMARIENLLAYNRIYEMGLKKEKVEGINQVIITYNHQLNNPLTIALGMVELLEKDRPSKETERLRSALERMSSIVQKIATLMDSEIEEERYTEATKMIRIK